MSMCWRTAALDPRWTCRDCRPYAADGKKSREKRSEKLCDWMRLHSSSQLRRVSPRRH